MPVATTATSKRRTHADTRAAHPVRAVALTPVARYQIQTVNDKAQNVKHASLLAS
jgi:hypothetical protein